jgi:hypothetical protein
MPVLGRPPFQPKEALSKTRQYPENAQEKKKKEEREIIL